MTVGLLLLASAALVACPLCRVSSSDPAPWVRLIGPLPPGCEDGSCVCGWPDCHACDACAAATGEPSGSCDVLDAGSPATLGCTGADSGVFAMVTLTTPLPGACTGSCPPQGWPSHDLCDVCAGTTGAATGTCALVGSATVPIIIACSVDTGPPPGCDIFPLDNPSLACGSDGRRKVDGAESLASLSPSPVQPMR